MVAKKNDAIVYKGVEYHLVFNLNVMAELQEEYGSLDEWGKLMGGDGVEPNMKAAIFSFGVMLNEGIDIDNEDNGTDIKPLTQKQVGRLVSTVGLDAIMAQMNALVSAATEDDSKNE